MAVPRRYPRPDVGYISEFRGTIILGGCSVIYVNASIRILNVAQRPETY